MLQERLRAIALSIPPEKWDKWLRSFLGRQTKKQKPRVRLKSGKIVQEKQGRLVFHVRQLW